MVKIEDTDKLVIPLSNYDQAMAQMQRGYPFASNSGSNSNFERPTHHVISSESSVASTNAPSVSQSSSTNNHPAFGGVGGTPAVLSGLTFGGPHAHPGAPGAGHPPAALFANEQANIFAPGSEWNNTADFMAAANSANNSLLMQQTANLAQAQGVGAQGEQQDLSKRIDSAANLRALLNHQISLFSSPAQMGFGGQQANNLQQNNLIQHSQAMLAGLGPVPAASSHPGQHMTAATNNGLMGLPEDMFRNPGANGAFDITSYLGAAGAQGVPGFGGIQHQ